MPLQLAYPQSVHEAEIIKYFGQNSLVFTDVNFERFNRIIFLVFSNRSGSTVIGEYLAQHPSLNFPEESLNFQDGLSF